MKELKQRFSRWHNRRVGRKGPVWEDRYKSVQVEDDETALRTIAAYIDLNPVRAGHRRRIPRIIAGAAMAKRWREANPPGPV